MSVVRRVYVEKKPGFDVKAAAQLAEMRDILMIGGLRGLRVLNRYDVEGLDDALFDTAVSTVFSEPAVDRVYASLNDAGLVQGSDGSEPLAGVAAVFAVEFLPGQFDQRASSAAECIQLVSQQDQPLVRSATVYALEGELSDADIQVVKDYVINPVEAREAALGVASTLKQEFIAPDDVEVLDGFLSLDETGLAAFIADRGLAMDLGDIRFLQSYFAQEGRPPTITEVKMVDTYWSDHCRHTTFGTELTDVEIADANVQAAFDAYLELRHELGRDEKPVCLMDMGTIGARSLKAKGKLTQLDESEEINACTVKVKVDVRGEEQDWLYLFKNETHNHPTEIEPFGGAATCLGGAIRDPLSGRAYVYQAMRVTGAADPTVPVSQTIEGKLPQRKLVTTAAEGYSSYGNQIGLATGHVSEIYHPGYAAKRMEIGAVVGATPASDVRRETPTSGDVIVLLGGRTGRDGIGGATGSSKAHSSSSIETCGAEVQKGNPPIERKIQRLFRNSEACRMIKRCNDFGAGGVSVAIGELADGLDIQLDKVPRKYEGLDGTELAISESQERMAVALASEDVDAFIELARLENLEATPVATVTAEPRVKMTWRGSTIVDVSREFLASNGAPKQAKASIGKLPSLEGVECGCGRAAGAFEAPQPLQSSQPSQEGQSGIGASSLEGRMRALVSKIGNASSKGLVERFDSTIGASTVLMPFGGKHQLTPAQAMVSKLPVLGGQTTTVSGLSWGFDPYLTERNPFEGSYIAVAQSIAKLVATGFERKRMYLTFQEYFEKLGSDPVRWGKPASALLGALQAQLDFEVGSIGGKDSMSGSFEDLNVPPTLVSFATAVGSIDRVVSPEFKRAGADVVWIRPATKDASGIVASLDAVEALIGEGAVSACAAVDTSGAAMTLFEMCVGNRIGLALDDAVSESDLNALNVGSFVVELAGGYDIEAAGDIIAAAGGIVMEAVSGSSDGLADFARGFGAMAASANSDGGAEVNGGAEAEAVGAAGSISGCCAISLLGATTADYRMVLGDEVADLALIQEEWESGIESVFPYRTPKSEKASLEDVPAISFEMRESAGDGGNERAECVDSAHCADAVGAVVADVAAGSDGAAMGEGACAVRYGGVAAARPKVIIPVFPGTNCEYDTMAAFEAAGADATVQVIGNLTPDAVRESADALVDNIKRSQIIMLPGGFSGGDEPDGSAKFIAAFFRSPAVTEAVRDLLQNRDGLMLGICNGFQALVKLGLLPYGDIVDSSDCEVTLTFNTIGRHQSRLVSTRVASTLSPWLSKCSVGDVHAVAISHGEGRFVAPDGLLRKMVDGGQVATQYVGIDGAPSMDLLANPNGSLLAIEGICSPDGRIFGKMGHSERAGSGLYKNVPGNLFQPIFESGVGYFKQ